MVIYDKWNNALHEAKRAMNHRDVDWTSDIGSLRLYLQVERDDRRYYSDDSKIELFVCKIKDPTVRKLLNTNDDHAVLQESLLSFVLLENIPPDHNRFSIRAVDFDVSFSIMLNGRDFSSEKYLQCIFAINSILLLNTALIDEFRSLAIMSIINWIMIKKRPLEGFCGFLRKDHSYAQQFQPSGSSTQNTPRVPWFRSMHEMSFEQITSEQELYSLLAMLSLRTSPLQP